MRANPRSWQLALLLTLAIAASACVAAQPSGGGGRSGSPGESLNPAETPISASASSVGASPSENPDCAVYASLYPPTAGPTVSLAPGSDLALEAVLPAEVDCVPLRKWSLAGDEVYWSFTTGMAYFMKALGLTTTDGMSVAVAAAENRPAFPVVLMVYRVRGIGTEALIPAWVQAQYLAWTQPIGADPTPTPNPSAKPAKPTPTWAPLLTAQQTIGGKPVTVLTNQYTFPTDNDWAQYLYARDDLLFIVSWNGGPDPFQPPLLDPTNPPAPFVDAIASLP